MPYTKVLIHFIWSTKNRQDLTSEDLKLLLLHHIKENSINKEIFIDTLNRVADHIHLLISHGSEQTIAKSAMLIKGESSFWVNKMKLIKANFEWQDEYIALSVRYPVPIAIGNKVLGYILNQEEHHKRKTFTEEYEEFLSAHHFEGILAKANT